MISVFLWEITLDFGIKRKNCFLFLSEIDHLLLMQWETVNSNSLFNFPMLFIIAWPQLLFPFVGFPLHAKKFLVWEEVSGLFSTSSTLLCTSEKKEGWVGLHAQPEKCVCHYGGVGISSICCFVFKPLLTPHWHPWPLLSIEAEVFKRESIATSRSFSLTETADLEMI